MPGLGSLKSDAAKAAQRGRYGRKPSANLIMWLNRLEELAAVAALALDHDGCRRDQEAERGEVED